MIANEKSYIVENGKPKQVLEEFADATLRHNILYTMNRIITSGAVYAARKLR